MSKKGRSSRVRIRLDISVCGEPEVSLQLPLLGKGPPPAPPVILHPTDNGTTMVKQVGGRRIMCAFGTGGNRHVFARVYENSETPPAEPPDHPDTQWDKPDGGAWRFDALPVPGNAGTKKLAVWNDNGTIYELSVHTFTAQDAAQTYCEAYGASPPAPMMAARDWSRLPERWYFTLAGCSNASCGNCGTLDGKWLLKHEPQGGNELHWYGEETASFADRKKPARWRLVFNREDGFWYLEFITKPHQPIGTSISYRRHESTWDPCGPNEMLLLTDHGYCNVPEFVNLIPA